MIDLRTSQLAREMSQLAIATREHAWSGDNNCKVLPLTTWIQALTIATVLAKENPRLDMPIPGADPAGHVWLTFMDGEAKGLALEILSPKKFRWTQNNMGDKRTFESDSLNDVAEAMRTVFPQALILCP